MNANSPFSRWLSSLLTISGNAAVQALTLVIFARTLGASEYAVIVVATAVATVAAEFVGFGSGDLLIRDVSRDRAAHRAAFAQALWLVALTIVPVVIVATAIAWLAFDTDATWPVLLALIASEIVATRLVFMSEQIAVAHHATHFANANRVFAAFVRLGAVCIAVFAAGVSTAGEWAVFAAGSALLAGAVCLVWMARKFGSPDFSHRRGAAVHVGILFSVMQILRALQYAVDKFAVAALASPNVVGAFGVASRVSQLGTMPTSAVTRITYPMFFAKGGEGLPAAIQLARRVAPAAIGIGLLSSAGLAGIAFLLPMLFGASFAEAEPFLLMLALLPVATALQNLGGSILSGADFQVQRVLAMAAGVVLTIAAAAAGAAVAGISGAVIGYMAGQFLSAAAIWLYVAALRRRG